MDQTKFEIAGIIGDYLRACGQIGAYAPDETALSEIQTLVRRHDLPQKWLQQRLDDCRTEAIVARAIARSQGLPCVISDDEETSARMRLSCALLTKQQIDWANGVAS